MNTIQHLPDRAETAMLSLLADDTVNAARTTGHGYASFHGYTIVCVRLPHYYQYTISHAGSLIAQHATQL